jgi:Tol biopolymer transport system component
VWPFWSPDGRALGFFADGQLKIVDLRGGAPRALCPVSAPSGGTWTADGVIVYAPALFGPLYRVPALGGECRPLTKLRPSDLDHRRPFALPNGRVLFHGYRANVMLVADVTTGAITEIRRPGRDAQFVAPNWVLFRDEENGPLYAQQLDMKTLRPRGEPSVVAPHVLSIPRAFARFAASRSAIVLDVPDAPGSARLTRFDRRAVALDSVPVPGDASTFALSHSGRFIAFGGFGMWLYDRDRGVLTHLALQTAPAQATSDPAWDPGDSLIAYRSAFAGTRAIRIYHVASGNTDSIPFALRAPVTPTWSPDGKRIAFTLRSGDVGTHEEIWIHSIAERRTWRAWEPKSDVSQPVWSPDGQFFAYQSDETGAQEVFIRPVDGSREAVRVSTSGGQAPQWRADGRAIFYRAPNGSIIEVSVVGAPDLRLSTPHVAVAGAPYASTNRSFAVAGNGDEFFSFARTDPPVFTLLVDWRERLH